MATSNLAATNEPALREDDPSLTQHNPHDDPSSDDDDYDHLVRASNHNLVKPSAANQPPPFPQQDDDPRLAALSGQRMHCLDAAGRVRVQASASVSAAIRVCYCLKRPGVGGWVVSQHS